MAQFQNTVLKVSVVIFIILMVLIALMMFKAKQNQVWPPEQSSCPDFWDWDESRKKCLNTKQLGNCTGSTDGLDKKCVYPVGEGVPWNSTVIQPSGGTQGDNIKCCWAKHVAGIEWDGITNNRRLCKGCDDVQGIGLG